MVFYQSKVIPPNGANSNAKYLYPILSDGASSKKAITYDSVLAFSDTFC